MRFVDISLLALHSELTLHLNTSLLIKKIYFPLIFQKYAHEQVIYDEGGQQLTYR